MYLKEVSILNYFEEFIVSDLISLVFDEFLESIGNHKDVPFFIIVADIT